MKIDIDRLTEAELIDLNNRIVERLRFLNQMRAHTQMLEMNYPAVSRGVTASVLVRHSVLDTESSRAFWIPAGVSPGENRGRYDELAASRGE